MPRRSNRTIIDAQVARFEEAGADPGVVRRLLDLLESSPQQRQLAAGRQTGVDTAMRDAGQTLDEAGERWRPLYELSKAPSLRDLFGNVSRRGSSRTQGDRRAVARGDASPP